MQERQQQLGMSPDSASSQVGPRRPSLGDNRVTRPLPRGQRSCCMAQGGARFPQLQEGVFSGIICWLLLLGSNIYYYFFPLSNLSMFDTHVTFILAYHARILQLCGVLPDRHKCSCPLSPRHARTSVPFSPGNGSFHNEACVSPARTRFAHPPLPSFW